MNFVAEKNLAACSVYDVCRGHDVVDHLAWNLVKKEYSRKNLSKRMKEHYMMADFQFCYCRKELLAESLEAISLRFEVSYKDGTEIRQIWDKDKLVIQVERGKDRTELQNLLRGYSYNILEGN